MVVETAEGVGGVIEGDLGADHRVDLDEAFDEEIDAGGVFAVGAAGALETDLAGDDRLQVEFDLRRDVADQGDGAAFVNAGERGLDGVGGADGFEDDVGTAAAGAFEDLFGRVAGLRIEAFGGAEFLGEGELGVVEIDGVDGGAAGVLGSLDGQEADHAGADDDGGVTEVDRGDFDGVDGDGDGFDQRGVFEGQFVGELVADVLGHGDVFGEGAVAAVIAAGDAENHAVFAEVHVAGAAEMALAAGDHGVERDAVVDLPLRHGAAKYQKETINEY